MVSRDDDVPQRQNLACEGENIQYQWMSSKITLVHNI